MGVIRFVLFQAEDLCCTGLGGDFIGRISKTLVRGTIRAIRHAVHAIFGDFPEAGMDITNRGLRRLTIGHQGTTFAGSTQHMRHLDDTVID